MAANEPKKSEAKRVPKKTPNRPKDRPLRYCALPPQPVPVIPPELTAHPERLRAIIALKDKWLNNTALHYSFFRSGPWAVPAAQAAVVRQGFDAWRNVPVGLDFVEVDNLREAEVRIGFLIGDGSWSAVGRDILNVPVNERTMNFGWRLDDDYGLATAIHEIGHTLGMPHEHQNPHAGIVWNEEAVYQYFAGPENYWSRRTTLDNVIRQLSPFGHPGSDWDPDSIMEYDFPASLIKSPAKYSKGLHPPGTISALDAKWIKRWYPDGDWHQFENEPAQEPWLRLSESRSVDLSDGKQVDFRVEVNHTRKYTISSFGAEDTVLGLFEEIDGKPRYLACDDDSGTDRTAAITHRLRPGRVYHVRLRLVHKGQGGTVTVMYW